MHEEKSEECVKKREDVRRGRGRRRKEREREKEKMAVATHSIE